jgi:hypothetical protein
MVPALVFRSEPFVVDQINGKVPAARFVPCLFLAVGRVCGKCKGGASMRARSVGLLERATRIEIVTEAWEKLYIPIKRGTCAIALGEMLGVHPRVQSSMMRSG